MKQRIFLFVLLLLSTLTASAYDAEVDGIYYNLNSSTKQATVTSGSSKYSGSVTIPSTVTYGGVTYSVTAIGDYVFYGSSDLTSIEIPNNVITMGNGVFYGCTSLTAVELPDGVSAVGNYVFYGCTSLKSVKLSERTANVSYYAFCGCTSLTSISFPLSVATIQNYAFDGCSSLKSITALNGIQYIAAYAFRGCTSLSEINASDDFKITYYAKFYDTAWRNDMPDGEIYIGSTLMGYKGEKALETLIVKEGTKYIYSSAFNGCHDLKSVLLPRSLVSIGSYAFNGCTGLTEIVIPSGVTSIDAYAFAYCSNLRTISIEEDLLANSVGAFIGTAWYGNLPDGPLYFGTVMSGYKGDKPTGALVVKDGTTAIGDNAFSGCSGLTSITFPPSLRYCGAQAFSDVTGVTEVNISDIDAWCRIKFEDNRSNPTHYSGSLTLNGAPLVEVVIPDDVTEIGYAQFKGITNLKSVKLHEGVTRIHNSAFQGCTGLSEINFPSSLTYIDGAFHQCVSLKHDIVFGNKVDTIASIAFYMCDGIPSVTLPASLKYIGDRSFGSDYGLKKIVSYVEDPEGLEPKEFTRMPFDCFSSNGFRLDEQPIYKQATLYVPEGTAESYRRSVIFGQFENIVEMKSSLTGDVNGDGIVNGTDIQAIINFILAGEYDDKADVNEDGTVNGTDIQEVINIIVSE